MAASEKENLFITLVVGVCIQEVEDVVEVVGEEGATTLIKI